ncbi:dienelactone hydrolase family protein [Nocardia sp. NPDC004860]|uniref:dienelactone hydrolase family protein n=1 Tax=Nocardia sp. NPDC004860 TaxID=3154557 RepID=UPI0033B44C58
MNDTVLIPPARSTVAVATATVPVLEISLGSIPQGFVLVLCDRGGLDRDADVVMNLLAEHGYESLAVEAGPARVRPELLVECAAERGWADEQIGMVGLGSGGRAVLSAAAEFRFGAAVSMSPTVDPDTGSPASLADFEGAMRTPWLGLFGAVDPDVAIADVDALANRLRTGSEVFTHTVIYPGVGRDFYRGGSTGLGYAASYDGWQRTIEWLVARVAPRLTPRAERWSRRRTALSA